MAKVNKKSVEEVVVQESQSKVEENKTDVVEELSAEVQMEKEVSEEPTVIVSSPKEEVAPTVKYSKSVEIALNSIKTYAERMSSKVLLDEKERLRQQQFLYNTLILSINNLNYSDFKDFFNGVISIVRNNSSSDDAFNERRLYRGMENINLSTNARIACQRLFNLLLVVANEKTMKLALKQIDINKTMEFEYNENGRNNLMNFFDL